MAEKNFIVETVSKITTTRNLTINEVKAILIHHLKTEAKIEGESTDSVVLEWDAAGTPYITVTIAEDY